MFFLEIAMLNGRAEQDFCTLARDECADPLLDLSYNCICEVPILLLFAKSTFWSLRQKANFLMCRKGNNTTIHRPDLQLHSYISGKVSSKGRCQDTT